MRKWIMIGIAFVAAVPSVSAAPAYGTRMPQQKQVFWGLQYYAILDRDLNKDNGDMTSRQGHVLLSYGVTDWLSLDLKASTGTIEHVDGNGDKIKYNTPVWGGGYGFRARVYQNGPLKVVGGFQHISIHPKTVKGGGVKHNAILDDWQGSALVSWDLRQLTPYTGVRYGTTDYLHRLNDDADRVYMDERRRFDAVVGADIPLSSNVWLNLEWAGGAGEALAASVNFHF